MRYFFHIAYHGFHYRGWQRQTGAQSVQEIIEDKLQTFFKQRIPIIGCGRTDAQVHASQYFFHVDMESILPTGFTEIFNKTLPQNISVYDVFKVDDNFHAQYSAIKRTYHYLIHTVKDPFLSEWSSYYPIRDLDFDKMHTALEVLYRYNDFYGLCKTPDQHSTTQCNISLAQLIINESKTHFRLEITSNRFLRGMIRMLVGKLLKIGQGNLSVEGFEEIIASKKTPQFLDLAYPQGLYLARVEYSNLQIPPKETIYWRP